MSKNILIVESANDKYFIEALISYMKIVNIEVDMPICKIDDYECLGGYTNLEKRLNELKIEIDKGEIEKVGIILDADEAGIEKRVEFINEKLKTICSDISLNSINRFERSEELSIEIACYITNIDGKGELETLMKTIKSKDSTFADCLEEWKKCLTEKGEKISEKDFDKFWINNYFKFDTCTKDEKKQAGTKCNNDIAIKKDIWNFEHDAVEELKTFLNLFK